jgi:hypothetical protein
VSGISVGVWSGLTTLTWVRAIGLALGCVLIWIMGLYIGYVTLRVYNRHCLLMPG